MNKKRKVVTLTSIFPASKSEVFRLLQKLELLSTIAYPYITFIPIHNSKELVWKESETFVFRAKLLGFIPFGRHEINVLEFNENKIYTNEKNTYVPTWNHEIILKDLENSETEYTDVVEIEAGWKTNFVYLWAKRFYAHRQRKWIKILKNKLM